MVPTRKPQARKKQIRKLQAKEMVPTRKPQARKEQIRKLQEKEMMPTRKNTSKPNTSRKLQKGTSQSKKQPDSDQLGGVVDVGPRIAHRQGS